MLTTLCHENADARDQLKQLAIDLAHARKESKQRRKADARVRTELERQLVEAKATSETATHEAATLQYIITQLKVENEELRSVGRDARVSVSVTEATQNHLSQNLRKAEQYVEEQEGMLDKLEVVRRSRATARSTESRLTRPRRRWAACTCRRCATCRTELARSCGRRRRRRLSPDWATRTPRRWRP